MIPEVLLTVNDSMTAIKYFFSFHSLPKLCQNTCCKDHPTPPPAWGWFSSVSMDTRETWLPEHQISIFKQGCISLHAVLQPLSDPFPSSGTWQSIANDSLNSSSNAFSYTTCYEIWILNSASRSGAVTLNSFIKSKVKTLALEKTAALSSSCFCILIVFNWQNQWWIRPCSGCKRLPLTEI